MQPQTKGKIKRAVCRVAGHGKPVTLDVENPMGHWTRFTTCSRCGHLLAIEEVPTHV